MDSDIPDDRPRVDANARDLDAHGRAAMLLVESLMHGLIARSVISLQEAVEMVDLAAEVEAEMLAEASDGRRRTQTSASLLKAISDSLKHDLPRD